MSAPAPSPSVNRDLLARPLSALFWWGLPLAIGWSGGLLHLSPATTAACWAVALGWMGAGCALNARRCRRLHCYIAAPVLMLGAVAMLGVAFGVTPFGSQTTPYVVDGTLGLALLSFLAEPVWGKYRRN